MRVDKLLGRIFFSFGIIFTVILSQQNWDSPQLSFSRSLLIAGF